MRPTLGLVSGTYNRLPMLTAMVESFRVQIPLGITYTITIVDGGSTDGTIDWCKAQSDINLIEHGELRGAIKAFTEGAYATDAKAIILANDDITFNPDSILKALIHLENVPTCGGVAFADNRPVPPYDNTVFKVLPMQAYRNGKPVTVPYAQVGMFRKWLGDRIGWWLGVNGEMAGSRTYAGDNFLSAKIWELGYSIDGLGADVSITDYVAEDELRAVNRKAGMESDDSRVFYDLWKGNPVYGPVIPPAPILVPPHDKQLRVLYLPIYEPGWAVQKQQKRGLREALMKGIKPDKPMLVYEVDYLSIAPKDLEKSLADVMDTFQPHLVLSQIQSSTPLTAEIIQRLRSRHSAMKWVNWNGDESAGGLYAPDMIKLLRQIDLQTCVNASALPQYKAQGIRAAYWQIGYEEPGEAIPLPPHDVVFLGSVYSEARKQLVDTLKQFDAGIYTPGDSNTLYNFYSGKALYQSSKIAISDNQYPNSEAFVSNRLFQALAAGGCLLLQQKVHKLEEYTGLIAGTHYIQWTDLDDLKAQIAYFLRPENEADRAKIAAAGTRFACYNCNFSVRVRELFEIMAREIPEQLQIREDAYLDFTGIRNEQFGITASSGNNYLYKPGQYLRVQPGDVDSLLAKYPGLFTLVPIGKTPDVLRENAGIT